MAFPQAMRTHMFCYTLHIGISMTIQIHHLFIYTFRNWKINAPFFSFNRLLLHFVCSYQLIN